MRTSADEKFHWEVCGHCDRFRETTINRKTGRYLVTFPRMCQHKDKCERELLNTAGFDGIIRDGALANPESPKSGSAA